MGPEDGNSSARIYSGKPPGTSPTFLLRLSQERLHRKPAIVPGGLPSRQRTMRPQYLPDGDLTGAPPKSPEPERRTRSPDPPLTRGCQPATRQETRLVRRISARERSQAERTAKRTAIRPLTKKEMAKNIARE